MRSLRIDSSRQSSSSSDPKSRISSSSKLIPQAGATHVPSTLRNVFMHNGLRET